MNVIATKLIKFIDSFPNWHISITNFENLGNRGELVISDLFSIGGLIPWLAYVLTLQCLSLSARVVTRHKVFFV
jgi:hypothetical protein